MFEKFTERARKVMSLSRQEAQRLNSEFIGTEHILLGIVGEGGGVAVKVFKDMNIDQKTIAQEVEKLITPSTSPTATLGQLPFSPRAKRVIELAGEAASQLSHEVIGTEHLLLGLIKENEGIAAQVLTNLGMKLPETRDRVLLILGDDKTKEPNSFSPKEIEILGTIVDGSTHDFTVLQRNTSKVVVRFDQLNIDRNDIVIGRRIQIKISTQTKFLD